MLLILDAKCWNSGVSVYLFCVQGEWVLSGSGCDDSKLFRLHMYSIKCENVGFSKDPLLNNVSEFAILFGKELDSEVYYFVFRL